MRISCPGSTNFLYKTPSKRPTAPTDFLLRPSIECYRLAAGIFPSTWNPDVARRSLFICRAPAPVHEHHESARALRRLPSLNRTVHASVQAGPIRRRRLNSQAWTTVARSRPHGPLFGGRDPPSNEGPLPSASGGVSRHNAARPLDRLSARDRLHRIPPLEIPGAESRRPARLPIAHGRSPPSPPRKGVFPIR